MSLSHRPTTDTARTKRLRFGTFVYALPGLELKGHVSMPELKIPGRETIAALPDWITFTPDSKRVYVSNSGIRSVSVVDTVAMKVTKVVPVGEVPKRNNTLVIPDTANNAVTPGSIKRAAAEQRYFFPAGSFAPATQAAMIFQSGSFLLAN